MGSVKCDSQPGPWTPTRAEKRPGAGQGPTRWKGMKMNNMKLLVLIAAPTMLLCSCAMTLPRAAESGNSAAIQSLLHDGAPVDQRGGSMDETALIIAARHGNLGIVKTLTKAGADIHARSKYGDTALTAATYFCHPNVSEFLIEQGADVNAKNDGFGSTPLMLAAECNDVAIVDALIRRSAKINETNKKGMTALTAAAIKGHVAVVQLLLNSGADTEKYGPKIGTALYEASQQGQDAIVKLLINKSAGINWKSKHNGWTPLMIAVAEGHSSTASILLEAGASVNLANDKGRTALMFAALYGNREITAALLKSGADPNLVPTDNEGRTALMAAATKGNIAIVKMLLDKGADPNLRNKEGKTALAYASGEVAEALRQAGAKE